jgi:D-3-phosphoglycerate dehydrogenase / 2-oxoglutarate reductase
VEMGLSIGILEPDNFSEEVIVKLSRLGLVYCFDGKDLKDFVGDLDVLFIRLGYQVDKTFLDNCPRLKYLCSPTTGQNHIDEEELQSRGIKLISLRGERDFLESIRATPEHTFGLILALLRRYKKALIHVDEGEWDRDQLRGEELYGKTVGIIGLGRVGYRVAFYCSAFESNVVFYDEKSVAAEPDWVKLDSVCEVIRKSQIVVLCASCSKQETPIICESQISLLEGKYFINTARGELVDETALMEAIEGGRVLGVATDVIASETGKNRLSRWRELSKGKSNIIITPHIAGATNSSMPKTETFIAENLSKRLK